MILRCLLQLQRRTGCPLLLSRILLQEWRSQSFLKVQLWVLTGVRMLKLLPWAAEHRQCFPKAISSAHYKHSKGGYNRCTKSSSNQTIFRYTTPNRTSRLSCKCGEHKMLQQRMWGETRKLVQGSRQREICHFCGRRCHVRCVAKAQLECNTEHFNARW